MSEPNQVAAAEASIYERLSAPFDHVFTDHRGGFEVTYISGEQILTRLNEVLGPAGWGFKVLEHGYNLEADEYWVLGSLQATIEGTAIERQQFGSQKVKRSRATEQPLDIGFDLKGATTDALKKCAMSIGVGLYLSHKAEPGESSDGGAPLFGPNCVCGQPRIFRRGENKDTGRPWRMWACPIQDRIKRHDPIWFRDDEPDPQPLTGARVEAPAGSEGAAQPPAATAGAEAAGPSCAECHAALKPVTFRDGTKWTAGQLAAYGQKKHGRVLCMQHYREANEARKAGDADHLDQTAPSAPAPPPQAAPAATRSPAAARTGAPATRNTRGLLIDERDPLWQGWKELALRGTKAKIEFVHRFAPTPQRPQEAEGIKQAMLKLHDLLTMQGEDIAPLEAFGYTTEPTNDVLRDRDGVAV